MPQLDDPQLDITIKGATGRPATTTLTGVISIMEIPDEERGFIKGISFYHNNHWQDFDLDTFEAIIIRRSKTAKLAKPPASLEVK